MSISQYSLFSRIKYRLQLQDSYICKTANFWIKFIDESLYDIDFCINKVLKQNIFQDKNFITNQNLFYAIKYNID